MPYPRFLRVLTVCSLLLIAIATGPVATAAQGNSGNAHACQQGGWASLARVEGPSIAFASEEACVSYGAQGGSIVALQPDEDGDGISDLDDNCPSTANPGQEDVDGDGIGNACEQATLTWVFTPGSTSPYCTATAVVGELFPTEHEYLIVVTVNANTIAVQAFSPSSDGSFSFEVPGWPVEQGDSLGADIKTGPGGAQIVSAFAIASC